MPTATESARPETLDFAELLASKVMLSKAARMLDLSVCQLHRLRLAGKLRCFKVAGRWFTTEEAMTGLITFPGNDGSAPAPGIRSAARRREIEAAHREASELLRPGPRRPA